SRVGVDSSRAVETGPLFLTFTEIAPVFFTFFFMSLPPGRDHFRGDSSWHPSHSVVVHNDPVNAPSQSPFLTRWNTKGTFQIAPSQITESCSPLSCSRLAGRPTSSRHRAIIDPAGCFCKAMPRCPWVKFWKCTCLHRTGIFRPLNHPRSWKG